MRYSATWIDTFLAVPPTQTRRELEFLERTLPLPAFRRILDLCCGAGRHSTGMAELGYSVLGIDSSERALRAVVRQGSGARFLRADVRAIPVTGPFDAALIMWQSFGGFDDETNCALLGRLHSLLRPGGRLVLDIYHRGFFEGHQDQRQSDRNGRTVFETKWIDGDRLHVRLNYERSDEADSFNWRVYEPDEILTELRAIGFGTVCCCSGFDVSKPASRSVPRMQLVSERL